ncbi:hypothetical protein TWF718_001717 [Orbilia javanica]|uniref:Uncharacterized protein n=1 Tax=Orbilia javanica TaxID=47235 RepID=A0AAN8RHJ4_9PEZI
MTGPTKIAVVTEAFRGLGNAIVRSMLHNTRQPLTIYMTTPSHASECHPINLIDDQETTKALETSGSEIKYAELDLQNSNSIEAFRDHLQSTYGESHGPQPLSILVNPAAELIEDPQKAVDIKYFGLKNLTKLLLPIIKRDGDSRIVNVSVGAGGPDYWFWKRGLANRFKLNNLTEQRLDGLMRKYLHDAAGGSLVEQGWAKRPDLRALKGHPHVIPRLALAAYTFLLAKENPGLLINVTGGDSRKFPNHVYNGAITPTFLALGSLEGATGRYWLAGEPVDWETNRYASPEPKISAAPKSKPRVLGKSSFSYKRPVTSKSEPKIFVAAKRNPAKPEKSNPYIYIYRPKQFRKSKPKAQKPVTSESKPNKPIASESSRGKSGISNSDPSEPSLKVQAN